MPILHIVLFEFKPVTTHAQVEDARARLTAQHQHQLTFLTGLQTHDRPGGQMHAPNPQRTPWKERRCLGVAVRWALRLGASLIVGS